MHATIMIFFVIIPLLTGSFGNFLIPLMIGARDMAFPRLNMVSYWFMWPAFVLIILFVLCRGRLCRGGLDQLSDPDDRQVGDPRIAQRPNVLAACPALRGHLVADGVDQLHHDDCDVAGSGDEDVPDADDRLGDVHHGDLAGLRAAGPDLGPDHADSRPGRRHQLLQPGRLDGGQCPAGGRRRQPAALPAPVLVLLAPGRLRHDPAGDGHGLGHHRDLLAQAALRLQADGLRDRGDRRAGLHRLGAPHVPVGHEPGAWARPSCSRR